VLACAHNNIEVKTPPLPIDKVYEPSAEEKETKLREEEMKNNHEKRHKESVEKIHGKMSKEYEQYQNCLANQKNKNICKNMLEEFCKQTHIDSKGNIHIKPYCENQK
jgi:hypothetical protein